MPLTQNPIASYAPILGIRPAEINATQHLPIDTKRLIAPIFLLRPWVSARSLRAALDKLDDCFGTRPLFVDIDPNALDTDSPRDVHSEIAELLDPTEGYRNWVRLCVDHENYIPVIQLGDLQQVTPQAREFADAGKNFALRFVEESFPIIPSILEAIYDFRDNLSFSILDLQHKNQNILGHASRILSHLDTIAHFKEDSPVSVSLTTFPADFRNSTHQSIYERLFYEELVNSRPEIDLIYSDRGSARAMRMGGGGVPAPRIDYALNYEWQFFRNADGNFETGYQVCAEQLMDTEYWDDNLSIWGATLIRNTARLSGERITSPVRATAARINIHMFRQAHFQIPMPSGLGLDEDWND